ncbi:MAG TPA: hypothetical protein VIH59_24370 [Candidatus Tectomicrobia bacterium]|jgi:hypothetical protein
MTFEELLDQAMAMLRRHKRVTYRALRRQFTSLGYFAGLRACPGIDHTGGYLYNCICPGAKADPGYRQTDMEH